MTNVIAFAPGRVELLGNHTDYNEGLVLGAAINRGLTVSGGFRHDGMIKLDSSLMGRVEIAAADLSPQTEATWANYCLGVGRELIDSGLPGEGFEARIEGDLPARSGLASSAALEVATALFLLKLHCRRLSPMELAKLCQRVEQRFVGVRSGLLDQIMSIFGRADHLILFDARSEQVQMIPFPRELAVIIANSGKQRELASGDYNVRREQCYSAARAFGVRALRDISSADLNRRTDLDPRLRQRARHIVGENERVERAIQLLTHRKARELGELMNESHQSSRENFENSTPELDLLVELARNVPGILGARLTGAGFGGAIVALCDRGKAGAASGELQRAYRQKTGIKSDMFACEIGPGAS